MGKISAILFAGLIAIVAVGAAALLMVEIPAPTKEIVRELPDDRFPQ
ncbi:MAG: hypothetical protein WEA84_14175 [Rhodovibrionaceae bacterium]